MRLFITGGNICAQYFNMADTGAGERKRKRFSKNKKKYWKKRSDVNDVEEFLEDQRLQERTGGLVDQKTDDQLFFLDSTAETQPEKPAQISRKTRLASKPLKCHAQLVLDPRIKPAWVNKNKKSLQKKTKVKRLDSALEKRRNEDKKKSRIEKCKTRSEARPKPPRYDLWGETEASQNAGDTIAQETKGPNEHYLLITKKIRRKPPAKFYEKPSGVAAVEVVHPGASYNPAYDDHQELLQKAHEVEQKKVKVVKKLQRSLEDKFPSPKDAPNEASYHKEMSSGLFDETDSDDSEPEFTEEELERVSYNPPVRRDRKKTERQRKKEKQRKDEAKKAQDEKKERIRKNEVFRLKSIKSAVRETLTERDERAKKRAELAETYKDKPKKLGKLKFEENDLEIQLSDEIKGSLRLLKPEGNLLEDRYKSLQKRNIIEPRKRTKKVIKYKRKLIDTRNIKNYLLAEKDKEY